MKTSNPEENFLTAVNNGKIGPFRSNSTAGDILSIFEGKIPYEWAGEDWLVSDDLEVFFESASLGAFLKWVTFKFSNLKSEYAWHRYLQLRWVAWLGKQNFDIIKAKLDSVELSFKSVRFADKSLGIYIKKYPATIAILFDEDGIPESLRVFFVSDWSSFFLLESLESHN